MDPFSRLPWFVLRDILSDLPDLFSLHSLYTASPGVARFLRDHNDLFILIIEEIIARPTRERGLVPYVQELIRLLVHLWSRQANGTDAVHSYGEILESIQHIGERPPRELSPVLRGIPVSTPPALLFRLLDLVARLRRVAHGFFHCTIERCLELSVEQLPQRDFTAQGKGMRAGKYNNKGPPTDPSQRPQGIPYAPVDIGPMSRLEEQRALGCLLCVVFFYDLRSADGETLAIREIPQRVDAACIENVEGFWDAFRSYPRGPQEQLQTLLVYLDEQAGGREKLSSWLRSVAGFEEEEASPCCREYTLVADDQGEWDTVLCRELRAYTVLRRSTISIQSPIRHSKMSVFRPYGLIFWEAARLQALGFPMGGNPMPLWFALSSIFSEQDWEDAIREQRARW
ncbi:hypothetical protein BJY00DRAFT_283618 [Aspergillus carlsbadensis]|nr:hypothetical protein BJY00DRAFT_283618 [Aspergillus carlsbadensis]